MMVLPSDDDETVETIPRIGQIGPLADDTHGNQLDAHLDGEEDEDTMISDGGPEAAESVTFLLARLIHGQCDAVEQNDEDGDASKPWPCDQFETLVSDRCRLIEAEEGFIDKPWKR